MGFFKRIPVTISTEKYKGEATGGLDERRSIRLKGKYEFLLHIWSSLEGLIVKLMRDILLIYYIWISRMQ